MVASLPLDLGPSRGDRTLPPGWRRVRFGDVVRNTDDNVRDPAAAGIERFVGLEHLDGDSLRIRRWGLVADGTTFTRKFVAGQVLFGKRRAYQRKVAVADFDGVCSSDILVFEPAGDALLPALLPYIVESEGFFQHALGTSAGSLSPRTKWRDLAEYELALPPKEEQRRIGDILSALERTVARWEDALDRAGRLKDALLVVGSPGAMGCSSSSDALGDPLPSGWSTCKVGDLLELCQYGLSMPMSTSGRYPIFRMMNINDGLVVENDM